MFDRLLQWVVNLIDRAERDITGSSADELRCPKCGADGALTVGSTYPARSTAPFRQCRFCGERFPPEGAKTAT